MDRVKIENVLFDMGVPAGIKGFTYIVDAVEYINKNPSETIHFTKELYPEIAKKARCNSNERGKSNPARF